METGLLAGRVHLGNRSGKLMGLGWLLIQAYIENM